MTEPNFPDYDFTFVIEQLLFERGIMVVKYTPVDNTLTSISCTVGIWPDMDINNLKPYLAKWAPKDKWYAQEMILKHGHILTNSQS